MDFVSIFDTSTQTFQCWVKRQVKMQLDKVYLISLLYFNTSLTVIDDFFSPDDNGHPLVDANIDIPAVLEAVDLPGPSTSDNERHGSLAR